MVTQRTDETNPGVCPPLPRTGLRLGRSLRRLGVDRRHLDDAVFGLRRQAGRDFLTVFTWALAQLAERNRGIQRLTVWLYLS
jgi:hypothetical protein